MIARIAALIGLITLPFAAMADVDIKEVKSEAGLTAWLVEAPEIPFISLEIRFRGGATLDPVGKEGAASLMAALLEEGTGDLDAQGFAAERDRLAAGFSFNAGLETVSISARFLSETKTEALDLLRRAITEPSFQPEAIDRVKGQLMASLRADAQDPEVLAGQLFNRVAFGAHPYGRPVDGTQASLTALTQADLFAARKATMARDRVYVAAVGDITAAELAPILDKLLGDLPETGSSLPKKAEVHLKGQTVVETFPSPQSVILFGQQGISRDDPEFMNAFVLAEILGGGRFGTRLMTEVREKRGLAYGIGAGLSAMDQANLIVGSVKTANGTAKETIDVIREEWAKIGKITQAELDAAKTYLTGAYPLRWDGNANIARQIVGLMMDGYPIDYPQKRNAMIEAVTLEDTWATAERVFTPKSLSFVVLGQPEGLAQQ